MKPIESGAFTTADLELLPDDGMRYELVDGVLLVTPTSSRIHQRTLGQLCLRLGPACPEDLEVFPGPLAFRPTSRLVLLPDLLVVRCDDAARRWIEEPLLLAVEILAPATRTSDQLLKRKLYEETRVASYWMLSPQDATLTVLELEDGLYVERAVVCGDEAFEAEVPFPVKVVPAEVIR
ncbi:Uma2 family endonuclease [Kribbella sp. NPDC023972]|uniref:Uma2 family endonuclease n=1 Tax=Kribbella sp. NPDC023972 TaxID=3154795 RepID=UPI0033F693F2